MLADPQWTDIAQTWLIAGQTVLLLFAAVFGGYQLLEARTLRREQARPFVIIDLEEGRKPFIDLVVRNIGATIARDVTFSFEPPFETTDESTSLDKLKMFHEGVASMPPGKQIRTFIEPGPARYDSDLPDTYRVTIRYSDYQSRARYEETMDLDFGLFWNRMSQTIRDAHDIHKEVAGIHKQIKKVADGLAAFVQRA